MSNGIFQRQYQFSCRKPKKAVHLKKEKKKRDFSCLQVGNLDLLISDSIPFRISLIHVRDIHNKLYQKTKRGWKRRKN